MDGDDDLIGGVRKSFDAPPYYGLRATWWQDQAFGFGLNANHAKSYTSDKYKNYAGYDRLLFTDGLNSETVNA